MKKILFITHDDLSGGSAKSLLAQILFFKKNKKIDPIVITWKKNSLYAYLQEKGILCIALKFDFTSVWTRNNLFHLIKRPYYRLFYNQIAYRMLKKKVDFSEISLIVSNSSVIDFGAYLHRITQIPHIWYLREFGDLDFNIIPYIKNLPSYIESNSDGIIAVSNAVAEHWNKRGIKKAIEVVYDGVVYGGTSFSAQKRDSIVKICMCGRLCPAKGQSLAISALKLLPKNILELVHLDFFGMGESEKKLCDFVKKEKLESYVSFKGFSDDLDNELNNYEIGLTLSTAEAFGRTTVEYMNHGLYVIGTNTGGTPELLRNGKFGTLIEPNNPIQLANVITNYCENRNKYIETNLLSHTCVKEKFSVAKSAESAISFYEKYMK